jgi:hypothetical protein
VVWRVTGAVSTEKVGDPTTEARQFWHVLNHSFAMEDLRRLIKGPVDSNSLVLGINDPNKRNARVEIFRELLDHFSLSVPWRINLYNEVWLNRRQLPPDLGSRPALLAIETNVRAANRVGTALGDDGRIVGEGITVSGLSTVRLE